MFEFATMLAVGKVICFKADEKNGGGFMKMSVARRTTTGKLSKSVFTVNITKNSWGYYTKYLHKGMKIKATLEMYRSEFIDKEQNNRERTWALATKIEVVKEVEDERPEEDTTTTNTATTPTADNEHKFSFEDTLPPGETSYVPF